MSLQTDNPDAPDYDWKADREWFNQRLANARIHNSELERKIAGYRNTLREIVKELDPITTDTIQRSMHRVCNAIDTANKALE